MAIDELLADRIRQVFLELKVPTEEKKMMGGLCFMVDDKMCAGTYRGALMARVDPEEAEDLLKVKGATQMELGGKIMKGYLHIQPEGYDMDEDLEFWVKKCLEFNPKAKSSKKK